MQRIYRGYTYTVQPPVPTQSIQPGVINWRYRIAGAGYAPRTIPTISVKPRALNWRYQMAVSV